MNKKLGVLLGVGAAAFLIGKAAREQEALSGPNGTAGEWSLPVLATDNRYIPGPGEDTARDYDDTSGRYIGYADIPDKIPDMDIMVTGLHPWDPSLERIEPVEVAEGGLVYRVVGG